MTDQSAPKPVTAYKEGFTLEDQRHFKNNRDLAEWLGGGNASVWVNNRPSEAFPSTATVPNRLPPAELPKAINPEIGKITVETNSLGTLTLDEFMAHPAGRAQAFMVIHKGQIAYENFAAMHPADFHVWMSTAKVIPGLLIDLLISEGKIDDEKTVGHYLEVYRGSAWEDIKVIDVMDMCTGLDIQEMQDGISYKPGSVVQRMLSAEFGLPYKGEVEDFDAVLRDAKKVLEPGVQFDYSSVATQVLVMICEAITGEPWAETVDKRVWSKVGFESALLVHTTPTGLAVGHGMLSTRLSDMGRFGMLYTPSWSKVANEQVVTDEILKRIQQGTRSHDFYMKGYGPETAAHLADETMISNARQWDAVWPDGDLFKSGFQQQSLYVSPSRDLVIVNFSVNGGDDTIKHYLRPIATSGLF
ncbi:serine hydrolase domain-containing protein [uncultured Roseibium sp.]|uniref:serine hydrolase domain-containing protein n=1 Tax=uncultured Roseibium sp. TaxID=1936171 RepID=UPI00261DCB46|nr:serine hydrolase domain-containing protein [uncultured Roseibium sp.]